jgi:putative ABC transport system permease protein
MLRAIDIKLLRELGRQRGQIASIAIVLASGIATFLMLRGTVESLESSRDAYYDRNRFADVFANLERAPESLARQVESLPGVGAVQTRVARAVLLPLPGMTKPAYGQLLSLPASRRPATNALYLERGRFPESGRDDEVVLLASFAHAHHLEPGHHVPAVLHGRLRTLRVTGLARSPEYIYALRPGAMIADPKRSAVLWMDRVALASAFELEGSFNEVSLRLQPKASEPAVRASLDRLLQPYGGDGAFGRDRQLSNRILGGELGILGGLSSMVPLVFLAVAVFLIRLVLGRMITLQRGEIALLKALGYANRQVGMHYLGLVAIVLLPGGALGILTGQLLGRVVLGMYAGLFEFPELHFVLSAKQVVLALLASGAAAGGAAAWAVRAAMRMPPAEAMRPPSPPRYRRGLLDRLRLDRLAGPSGSMVLREIQRRPLKTAMSSLGIAGAISLMILGRFGLDSFDHYLEQGVMRENRQDLSLLFSDPLPPRAAGEIGRLPGVLVAEGLRTVPIRAHFQHRSRDSLLLGLPGGATLRHLIERSGREVRLPEQGVLLTRKLGEVLGVRSGERITLEVREGERPTIRPLVRGFVDEASGLQVYARTEIVAALSGDLGAVSAVLLRTDPLRRQQITAALTRYPRLLSISELHEEIDRRRDQQRSTMRVWSLISSLMAAAVVFGVVYNNARIALTARARDLASLRVLGFSRREISLVLLGGLGIEVVFAIPFGLMFGRIWADQFMRGVDQEQIRLSGIVAPATYLVAAGITLLAATASALWVRRGLDRLDLIGVLKTRE